MIANLAGGTWRRPDTEALPVYDPATGEVIEQVPLSGGRRGRRRRGGRREAAARSFNRAAA